MSSLKGVLKLLAIDISTELYIEVSNVWVGSSVMQEPCYDEGARLRLAEEPDFGRVKQLIRKGLI